MSNPAPPSLPLLAGRNYRCHCGQPVFFRNSVCLACRTPLGYDCERGILLPLERVSASAEHEPAGVALWRAWHGGSAGTSSQSDPAQLQDIPGQQSAPSGSMPTQSALDSVIAEPGSAALYKRCLNLSTPASCNWLIHASDAHVEEWSLDPPAKLWELRPWRSRIHHVYYFDNSRKIIVAFGGGVDIWNVPGR